MMVNAWLKSNPAWLGYTYLNSFSGKVTVVVVERIYLILTTFLSDICVEMKIEDFLSKRADPAVYHTLPEGLETEITFYIGIVFFLSCLYFTLNKVSSFKSLYSMRQIALLGGGNEVPAEIVAGSSVRRIVIKR